MKRNRFPAGALRRTGALLLAGVTLWMVAVTAGTHSFSGAWSAVRIAAPKEILRWELGDFFSSQELSPTTVLAISQSPLLLSARQEVAALWKQEEDPEPFLPIRTPVEEETTQPVPPVPGIDNAVPSKTLVPTDPSGYTVCGRVYINNATDHTLSVPHLQEPFDAELTAESPQVLILHTHGSEAYTPAEDPGIVWSGDHRTTDSRYNVVRMGDVMADVFAKAGISVLHDRTLYDYPNYSGAYDRSLSAIESYLAQYPSIRFILDVHRDAIVDAAGTEYKVVSDVGDAGTSAQLTLVLGSDGSGLPHPKWLENLRLAVAVQQEALTQYPTLMRPILLRNSRYNQHATTGSLLVEVGAAGNAPEEAALAARLFAESMVEVLQARSK